MPDRGIKAVQQDGALHACCLQNVENAIGGAVRRLDDVLLAVFGPRYVGLQDNQHRIALLENRFRKIGG